MKKTKLTRSLLAACSIVALTAVMYGCVHTDGRTEEPATDGMDMPDSVDSTDLVAPEPVEQAGIDAQDAADDAKTAADNAKASADAADTARTDAATTQSDETSSGLAAKAREAADKAQTAADNAQTAADAAKAATDGVAAGRALVMAENARDAAMGHETSADTYGQMAEDAAGGMLKIDGTMKTVGGTTIDAEAERSVVTIGEGATG